MLSAQRKLNPVFWQEWTHQTRSGLRATIIGQVAGPLLIVGLIALCASSVINPDLSSFSTRNSRDWLMLTVWVVHAIVAARCILAGANAISREHVGQTWDALVLTGLSARQIMLGKWAAAMRRAAPWVLALTVIRLSMLPILAVLLTQRFAFWTYRRMNSGYYDGEISLTISWLPWAWILSVVATVALTVLEAACCTALGLFGSTVTRRGAAAIALAALIRFAPVAIFAGFTRYELGNMSWRYFRYTPFALADGGTSPVYQLVSPLMQWTAGRHEQALGPLLLVIGMLGLMTFVAISVALVLIRRNGALTQRQALEPALEG
jgi:hypothetical protein